MHIASLIEKLKTEHASALERVQEEEERVKRAEKDLFFAEEASEILQAIAKSVQKSAHERVSAIVTRCLQAIFDESYEFVLRFESKRGRTEARPTILQHGHDVDPMNAACGGVVDVAAFALRVAAVVLTRPRLRRLIVQDEPFKNLNGEEYQQRAKELLTTLPKELDFQLVLATDDDWLRIGKVIEL